MEKRELAHRIRRCDRRKHADKQFENLEKCAECKGSSCDSVANIINYIRSVIEEEGFYGVNMSEREKKLSELEEQLRVRNTA